MDSNTFAITTNTKMTCRSADAQNPEFWDLDIQKFGIQNMKKVKILKIQICSAQNVGTVWISRNKNPPGPIWAHLGRFFAWAEKNPKNVKILPIFLAGPMGPIQPLWAAASLPLRFFRGYESLNLLGCSNSAKDCSCVPPEPTRASE